MPQDFDLLELFRLYNNGNYADIINTFDRTSYKAAEDPDISKLYAAAVSYTHLRAHET